MTFSVYFILLVSVETERLGSIDEYIRLRRVLTPDHQVSQSIQPGFLLTTFKMEASIKNEKDDVVVPQVDGETRPFIDPAREKKLLMKLDMFIAPVVTLIFLAAYLDRSNIGNASSAGMTKDLKMTSGQLGSEYIPTIV